MPTNFVRLSTWPNLGPTKNTTKNDDKFLTGFLSPKSWSGEVVRRTWQTPGTKNPTTKNKTSDLPYKFFVHLFFVGPEDDCQTDWPNEALEAPSSNEAMEAPNRLAKQTGQTDWRPNRLAKRTIYSNCSIYI